MEKDTAELEDRGRLRTISSSYEIVNKEGSGACGLVLVRINSEFSSGAEVFQVDIFMRRKGPL
jgi:hypothetical protein